MLFGEIKVRMQGIAAPEYRSNKKDPGGRAELDALAGLANGRVGRCELDGTTANRRPGGICYLDAWSSMPRWSFWALARDRPAYSGCRYADEEVRG